MGLQVQRVYTYINCEDTMKLLIYSVNGITVVTQMEEFQFCLQDTA